MTSRYLVGWVLRIRNRHFFTYDVFVLAWLPALVLALRVWDTGAWEAYASSLLVVTVAFLAVKLPLFYRAGLYRKYWRYASIDELAKITLAGIVATALQTVLLLGVLQPFGLVEAGFPRSLAIIEGIFALAFVGGSRFSVRLVERMQQRLSQAGRRRTRQVLVVGAGEAGLRVAAEMQANPHLGLWPVAFVDDNPEKLHVRMRGIDVKGRCHDIPRLVEEMDIDLVVVAMPTAPGAVIRDISAVCDTAGVDIQVLPGIHDLLNGGAAVHQIRDIRVEDLLRRPCVQTNVEQVRQVVTGRRILVTGGGGSIGSELSRQLLRLEPSELILLGHGENSIFLIEAELRQTLAKLGRSNIRLHSVIADIRDVERMSHVFRTFRPEIVFHAAAHKHVPLMEANIADAVTNNVWGTKNLLDQCKHYGVERFVMISSDKAVNPTNVMGATKRIAELLVHQAALETGRPFVAVRFGNVLGSRGSVLQIFREQIARGGPITVTHPDVKRYFMTIPEAVQLVLQAGSMGRGSEVFALDMGEPVRITDLAADVIRLSKLRVGRDIEIVYSGLRPGEKLFEELFTDGEEYERTSHEKIFRARFADAEGDRELIDFAAYQLTDEVERLILAAGSGDEHRMREQIQFLVPTFARPAHDLEPVRSSRELMVA